MIDIITYGIIILAGGIAAFLIAYPLRFVWKPIYSCIIGTGALILANLIGIPFGFSLGINLITVLVCGLLGVPGFTMLVLFKLLL
ncbi:MAG: pro-sigmaK processing inhibitor BofA family protein [Bacillota bacterium]|nr:pro-sigmaK processing inhibitor BofA family protein [Bacillota bacterium]